MNQPLRPMNLGEILDRTFQIYKSRFLVFAGIASLPALVMTALYAVDYRWLHFYSMLTAVTHGENIVSRFLFNLAYYHVSSVVSFFIYPAAVRQCSDALMDTRLSFVASLRFVGAQWRTYLWVSVIRFAAVLVAPETLIVGIFLAVAAIVYGLGAMDNDSIMTAAALLIPLGGMVCFFWLSACFSFAVQAAALEKFKGLHAMRRSWSLSHGTRTRVTLVWLLIFVFIAVFQWCTEGALSLILTPLYGKLHDAILRGAVVGIVYGAHALTSALLGPIYPIAMTLFYYDQRIRKEGYDIEQMMLAAGWTTDSVPVSQPLPAPEALSEAQA